MNKSKPLITVLIILISFIYKIKTDESENEFTTVYGKIKGAIVDGYKGKKVILLKGVPFAEPPVGDLRFKKTKEITSFKESPLDATKNFPFCMQMLDLSMKSEPDLNKKDDSMKPPKEPVAGFLKVVEENQKVEYAEDCLYMNIYIPVSKTKKKSIAIYFHGGAFMMGGASIKSLDFSVFSSFSDVIVVVPQYRLSVFGFLYGKNAEEAPGNQGLWDQHYAIKFISEIAESIGGSKKSITLWGSSSGGWSVGHHMFSPASQNLFDKIIFQSGSAMSPFLLFSEENSLARFRKFAFFSKCADMKKLEKDVEYVLRPDTYECIRKLSVDDIVKATKEILKNKKDVGFIPAEDQDFFGGNPFDTITKNQFGTVKNVLMGTNSNEGGMILTSGMKDIYPPYEGEPKLLDLNQLFEHAKKNGANSNSGQIQLMLPMFFRGVDKKDPIAVRNHLLELIKDSIFVCPDMLLVDEYSLRPGRKLFYYVFDHRPANTVYAPWLKGSQHYDELQFIMGYPFMPELEKNYPKIEQELSRKTMTLWANFIKTGNPVTKSKIKWQPCVGKERSHIVFSGKSAKSQKGFVKNHCKDLTRYYSMGRSFLKNYKS